MLGLPGGTIVAALKATAQPNCRVINFGGNQTWRAHCYRPRYERDVLEILQRHRHGHVRPFGALHSWSDVAAGTDAAVDMSCLDQVRPFVKDGAKFVRVGGGCRLHDVLDRLHAESDQTLPTLGAITRQTVAGAISTGTHGSGNPSLSHFVAAVQVAGFDADGTPKIFEYQGGDALAAARCALGGMGVILSVVMHTVPKYLVEETVRSHRSLHNVISRYDERPLTQFILVPYRWTYLAWERRATELRTLTAGERLSVRLLRAFNNIGVDVMFHLLVKAAVVLHARAVKTLMKLLPYLLVQGVARLDDPEHVLTLKHHYFRHEEMEIFVPEPRLAEAVNVLHAATDVFAGETTSVSEPIATQLKQHSLYDELMRQADTYVQHYPFFFRRILRDDTLISMASGDHAPYYSISVFTYLPPEKRQHYYAFCSWLARAMTALLDARLHWGKHFPLSVAEVERLYPDLERFRQLCQATDANGVFRNDYTRRVLGL
jgi:L-gulono-1,4-lactone dehydrogenase